MEKQFMTEQNTESEKTTQETESKKLLHGSKNIFTTAKTLTSVLVGLLLVLACILIF